MSTTWKENTLPLTVENTGFLLDKLGEECHPLQFLRELTQNSIEAINRTPDKEGEIIWDVDWLSYELGTSGAFKLSITDNGCGMVGDDLVRYINKLSSSASIQASDGNYGVGAKIAAATRNHAGLIYLSWVNGRGSMIHLWRDPSSGVYGLRQLESPDGTYGHYAEVEDDIKPGLIKDHGTRIILYGNQEDEDTMKAPPGASTPSAWISKYLNSRYFRIPEGIKIKARQGWTEPRDNTNVNVLRTVTGQEKYLEDHKEASGKVSLKDATAHWWILRDEKALGSNSGFIESAGHVAALYDDELYELSSGRSGHAKLQQFGIIFGQKQVVIYIEPHKDNANKLTTNTARTALLINSQPVPWERWASEFRENIPHDIEMLMEQIASQSKSTDHSKSIRDRLKSMMDLYKVSRYRPQTNGRLRIDDPTPNSGGERTNQGGGSGEGGSGGGGGSRGPTNGVVGGVYSAFLRKNGQSGTEAKPDVFPRVQWVSVDAGTREKGDIEDKAARFVEEINVLYINEDFRVFTDMIEHWMERYASEHGDSAGLREKIRESVHGWFEQALTETIIGLQALRGSREWSVADLKNAWSEEALTSVVMQRYHPYNCVKRELGTTVAPLRK